MNFEDQLFTFHLQYDMQIGWKVIKREGGNTHSLLKCFDFNGVCENPSIFQSSLYAFHSRPAILNTRITTRRKKMVIKCNVIIVIVLVDSDDYYETIGVAILFLSFFFLICHAYLELSAAKLYDGCRRFAFWLAGICRTLTKWPPRVKILYLLSIIVSHSVYLDEKHHCYTWTPFDGHQLLARRNQRVSSPVSLASISWNSHLTVGWKSPFTSALELCLFERLPWNRRKLIYEIPIKRAGFKDGNVRTWSVQPLPPPSARGWEPRGIYLSSNSVTVDFSNKAKISLPR